MCSVAIKLFTICVCVSIAQAASIDLCVKKTENINKNLNDPVENKLNTGRLLLRDCPPYPFIDNAVDHIRSFIVDKLDLTHLEWHILQATYTDKGLLFEMSSAKDVRDILERFAVKFRNKDCVLKTTIKDFIAN